MSVRQYIGARYVTKIYENSLVPGSAEWEAGVTYEPLTLVTYQNSSYLSKKEVPGSVGNPALNTSYWVVTGAYNGQIATLQQQIDNIINVIIPAIQHEIYDYRVIVLGDSYANRVNANNKNYIELIQAGLGLTSDDFFSDHIAGGAYIHGTPDHTFKYMIENIAVTDPDTITDLYVVGGANDQMSTYNDLWTAMSTFYTAAKTRFPKAKCHNIPVGITMSNNNMNLGRNGYALVCKDLAQIGFRSATNAEFTLLNSDLLASDWVHPSADGVDAIANACLQYIDNGICHSQCTFDYTSITPDITIDNLVIDDIKRCYLGATRKDGIAQLTTVGTNSCLRFRFTSSQSLSFTNKIVVKVPKCLLYNQSISNTPVVRCGDISSDTGERATVLYYVDVSSQECKITIYPSAITGSDFYINLFDRTFEL